MYNPLEQFDIIIIMNLYKNFTLTNFSIVLVCNFVFILLSLHNFKSIFKVDNVVFVFLNLFNLIKNLLKDNIQIKKHSVIFLFYFLFLLILISNLIGMIPYSTTVTSHLIFTLYYALGFFIGINIIGVLYHKERYFTLFLPEGVPVVVIPLLIIIEYVSYYARIISLSVRLFANMMSGHILMKILIGFV
jgi:ATP synthase subunit 6